MGSYSSSGCGAERGSPSQIIDRGETRSIKKAAKAGGAIGAGGVLAHAALYLLLFTLVFGLASVMPLWAAGLIVAAFTGGAAALLIFGGIKAFKRVQIAPRQTLHKLQEDKQWMKEKAHALKSTIRANA